MAGAKIHVTMPNGAYDIECADDETLMRAMQRAGIDTPSSCQEGECGTCRCLLEDGMVELRKNQVLDEKELKAGWILACQAAPKSNALKVRFPED